MEESKQTEFTDNEQQAVPLLDSPKDEFDIKSIKPYLGTYHEADDFLKDNEYIVGGYRIGYNKICRVLKSLFICHNETVNIWSHLLGLLLFFSLIFYVSILLFERSNPFRNLTLLQDNTDILNNHSCISSCRNIKKDVTSFLPELNRITDFQNQKQIVELNTTIQKNYKIVEELQQAVASKCCCFESIQYFGKNEDLNNLQEINECILKTSLIEKLFQSMLMPVDIFSKDIVQESISLKSKHELLIQNILELNNETKSLKDMKFGGSNGFIGEVSKVPLIIHILCAMICLFFSSFFHLFCCHSKELCTVLSRFDYAGIAVLIAGSCVPQYIYAFYCPQIAYFGYIYTSIIFVACTASFTVSLIPRFDAPRFRKFRAGLFVIVGVSSAFPGFHVLFFSDSDLVPLPPYPLLIIGGALYIIGAGIYSARIPERFWKGKFDYCGNSHNIWHCFVLGAACVHFCASLAAYAIRIDHQCPS